MPVARTPPTLGRPGWTGCSRPAPSYDQPGPDRRVESRRGRLPRPGRHRPARGTDRDRLPDRRWADGGPARCRIRSGRSGAAPDARRRPRCRTSGCRGSGARGWLGGARLRTARVRQPVRPDSARWPATRDRPARAFLRLANMQTNRRHGQMTVDEIPGLSFALALPGERVELHVRLLDDSTIDLITVIPEITAALCVKVLGYADRLAAKDALDVWRLLAAYRMRVPAPLPWRDKGVQGDAAK